VPRCASGLEGELKDRPRGEEGDTFENAPPVEAPTSVAGEVTRETGWLVGCEAGLGDFSTEDAGDDNDVMKKPLVTGSRAEVTGVLASGARFGR
jgi:hypothetical protein